MLEWRTVFWVAFGVLTVTAVVYSIWASGEVQPFNDIGKNNKQDQEKVERTSDKVIEEKL